ncbi:hypothetical protein [Sedimentibacter sp.]|uniref:hypothetical protein n=1 Tax=Sedimentibacter sp. TaxID=1960295 RepID=UPI00289E12C5|nr:hypothetical protein [Sedimentibacter sp.]
MSENLKAEKWELEKIKSWSTNKIKNWIWMAVSQGQPIPGCVSVYALKVELLNRGQEPTGYHNT